jgi:hypothetical protein
MQVVNENDNDSFMGETSNNESFMVESGSHFLTTNTPGVCSVSQKGNPVEQIMTTYVICDEFDV